MAAPEDLFDALVKSQSPFVRPPAISARPKPAVKKAPAKQARPPVSFESVILPEDKRQQIMEALEQIKQYDLIFDTWGFGDTMEKGKGVSMLFWGPPGTGKTLGAQALATETKRKLKVIAAADIESNVPGEAERNIRKHFKTTKPEEEILLFDECDSLIFSRQYVGPIFRAIINELLTQIEKYDGITIFTTNTLGLLDDAVNRRLALKLEFAMPTFEDRIKIWQRMFPARAPLHKDVDWELLAECEVTGGYIKNAVLRAARMAACEQLPNSKKTIRMKHLRRALKQELESMVEFEKARKQQERGHGLVMRGGDINRG